MRQPTIIDRHVADFVKQARLDRRLSLKAAASALGISYQQLQKYESGRDRISAGRLYHFSQIYIIPIQDFFRDCEI